ncbi:MAG: S9 family peptidase [Bacteroidota bacterium]
MMKRLTQLLAVFALLIAPTVRAQQFITLEDIWSKGTFSAKGISGFNSMSDGRYYTAQDDNENIIRYAFATGKAIDTLAKKSEIGLSRFSYTFSANEQMLLLQTNFKQLYRHSYSADIYLFDLTSKKLLQPTTRKVMLPEISPSGKHLAYVFENNLYIYDLATGKEKQLTTDGKLNSIINGATDWVYEEEFGLSKGFYWNADGSRIAYYRFDESQVKEFSMAMYGELYPENYTFKYPKAGEANSVIQIITYQLSTDTKTMIDIGTDENIYIPRICWSRNTDELMVMRMNRLQNKLELMLNNLSKKTSSVIYTEENAAYVEVPEITFMNDGSTFILNSEKDGWNHLYRYSLNGSLVRKLTSGNWDVDKFYGVNEKRKEFYICAGQQNSTERYVYALSMDGKQQRILTTRKGWNSATFNSDFSYFMLAHSSLVSPPYFALCTTAGKEVRVLEDNQSLSDKLKNYSLSSAEMSPFKNENGDTLNGFIIKPTSFNANTKYPVLMYVYGGPGHQLAVNRWMGAYYFWFQMLAAKGYIVVCTDGRGTGFKGEKFKKCTYLQLGKYELEDQIYVARQLGKLPYVDATRIGMFGWSFGGYMSSLAITKGADIFKTAIAVAPVTNWRYYDNIYTERFMRTPQENGKNYDDNSPIHFVDKIKGNYLIIHGTADDNVHFQNAVEMVNAMINKGVRFDSEFYPNKNHGIGGGKTRLHLFERMTRYITEKL